MKRLAAIIVCSIVSFSAAAGQSGRRFEKPAAEPAADREELRPPDFSESASRPRSSDTLLGPRRQPIAPNVQPPASSQAGAAPTANDGEILKIETSLVTIPVSVFDRSGVYVTNLGQSDFKVYEDGIEQTITYFGTSDKPFTVVLLLDTSVSTIFRIEDIQNAALAFINQLKPQDRIMVVEFDEDINVLAEPTNDRARLAKAIRKADFGYGTSLYDSVNFVLRKRLQAVTGRKAIVLFTDGVDTTSHKSGYDSTLAFAEETDTLVFPVYYNTFKENIDGLVLPTGEKLPLPPPTISEYVTGKRYLEKLAENTGGRVFRPESTPGGLTAAFEGIAEELRRQYNLGYVPIDDGKPGQRKQIRVRVNRPNLVIRARDSYTVGANRAADSPASR